MNLEEYIALILQALLIFCHWADNNVNQACYRRTPETTANQAVELTAVDWKRQYSSVDA